MTKLGMPAIGRIYAAYQAYKKENHLMDYDDMLDFVHIIFRKLPDLLEAFRRRYSHVLVDEAQDTSKLQHAILLQLCTQQGNLFWWGMKTRASTPSGGLTLKPFWSSPRSTPELSF